MDNNMFCFQCEQTANCTGCIKSGVCGKTPEIANLQDKLTGAIIRLAEKNEMNKHNDKLVIKSLFATITNVNFNEDTITKLIDEVHDASGINVDYDMNNIWNTDEDIRSLKSLILFGIRGIAAYAYHAQVLGYEDKEVNAFFYEALRVVGADMGMEELLPVVLKVGEINLACMALLDEANTKTYGNPVPTEVPLTVEKGPFIIITGHELYDLKQLLK